MKKTEWLEQTDNWLEQSNQNVVILPLWKEAKHLTSLQNLLNPVAKSSQSDIYQSLIKFESNRTDKRDDGRTKTILNN